MSKFWDKLIRPVMFRLDAELAHDVGMFALRNGPTGPFVPSSDEMTEVNAAFGEIERFGLKFDNPLGVAAGFDKNGIVVNQLAALGFGFVEVGTVTFDPQGGNPKPRLFRLPDDKALINRLGFNNDGASVISERLKTLKRNCIVGVNIGKNKDVPNDEAAKNYIKSFDLVHRVADYVAVNISSPNTPELRELQKGENFEELVSAIQLRNLALGPKPLLVKIAPDLTRAEIESIVDVALRYDLSGIIATNTTVSREGLKTPKASEMGAGGVSGMPLGKRSTEVISKIYSYSKGILPIIGVGGIFTTEDAFAKIAAGASLLQVYTGFVFGGPTFAAEINRGLAGILRDRGFQSLDQAVGSDAAI